MYYKIEINEFKNSTEVFEIRETNKGLHTRTVTFKKGDDKERVTIRERFTNARQASKFCQKLANAKVEHKVSELTDFKDRKIIVVEYTTSDYVYNVHITKRLVETKMGV